MGAWGEIKRERNEIRKTRGNTARAVSVLPGMLVEEETRPKEGPMGKRPVEQSYGDFLFHGRRDKGNGGRGKMENPGWGECPPYLYAWGEL